MKLVRAASVCVMLIMAGMMFANSHALADTEGLTITTRYVSITIFGTATIYFPINVTNTGTAGETVAFTITTPKNWTAAIIDGGFSVRQLYVGAGAKTSVSLRVSPPTVLSPGNYTTGLTASTLDGIAKSSLSVTADYAPTTVAPSASLTASYPVLSGATGTSFTFTLNLANNGGKAEVYNLIDTAPQGWTVSFTPQLGSTQITSLSLNAGATQGISMTAVPPLRVSPGNYTIHLTAVSPDAKASLDLGATITGTYGATFSTIDGKVNAEATTGQAQQLTLVLKNTGTSTLTGLALTSNQPSGWTVVFNPSQLGALGANSTQQVNLSITPSSTTLPGDYIVTVTLANAQVSKSIDIRMTADAPIALGLLGVGVVAVVLVALAVIFLRFGRR